MMKQMIFADADYIGKSKQTRKELFLIDMDEVLDHVDRAALSEERMRSSGLYIDGDTRAPDAKLVRLR
ncbi:hypothetical protein SAMN05444507_10657 [Pseudomonas syringae]|nr:hypothetical protein SAMN05444507_10657 [Pseudomonas syringae]